MKRSSSWRIFFRRPLGVLGAAMLLFIVLLALLAPTIAPYDPYAHVTVQPEDVMAPPSPEYLLGQDDAGRDVLSLLLYGARVSLTVGFAGYGNVSQGAQGFQLGFLHLYPSEAMLAASLGP